MSGGYDFASIAVPADGFVGCLSEMEESACFFF